MLYKLKALNSQEGRLLYETGLPRTELLESALETEAALSHGCLRTEEGPALCFPPTSLGRNKICACPKAQ